MAKPAVAHWRGTPLDFPKARVYKDSDDDLVEALRTAATGESPVAIDLFSGAGGLSLGLEGAGFNVALAADTDPSSCKTHANSFDGVMVNADLNRPEGLLKAIERSGIEFVDLVAGGPPCQPFSRAGRSKIRSLERTGKRPPDERPRLWTTFLRFVDSLKPTMVLIENVPDMVLWENGQTLRQISGSLEARGYAVETRVLKCWQFGVPQHRQRLFIIGSKVPAKWPTEDVSTLSLQDAIDDLPKVGPSHRNEWIPYVGPPRTDFQKRMRQGSNGQLSDHVTRSVRDDDREAFQLLKSGKRYSELPKELQRYRSDIFDDKYTILKWNELSRSITAHLAKDGYWYIHPDGERMLSIREAARLQTFPDHFRFAGFPSDQLRQIGNAVPPAIAERLGASMVAALGAASTADAKSPQFRATTFRQKLSRWHKTRVRKFAWRDTRDPWLVFMAEMLLRRTRAQAVSEVWPRLVHSFRTPQDVIEDEAEFRDILRPLGLTWRVDNLVTSAQEIVAEHKGWVPKTREGLKRLPGVGDYVCEAVLAFAHGQSTVLVDSNTARIASRIFGLPEKWSSLRNLNLRASVARLGGVRPPTPALNLALLDLGGTVCLPLKPRCGECPVRTLCIYGSREEAEVSS